MGWRDCCSLPVVFVLRAQIQKSMVQFYDTFFPSSKYPYVQYIEPRIPEHKLGTLTSSVLLAILVCRRGLYLRSHLEDADRL